MRPTIGGLPPLYNIAIGCMLGDACMYRVSKDAKIKFEQGGVVRRTIPLLRSYMHKDYLYHLFDIFKNYTFHDSPYFRYDKTGLRKGLIKSYSFRTFTHPTFNPIWDLFIEKGKKAANN